MDRLLVEAMEHVLRDLEGSGITAPRIEDRDWADDSESASVMLWSADGSGRGLSVQRAATEAERIAVVADQVQEWVIEELWGRAPTNWPRCPRHPRSHPMGAAVRANAAVWICPADDVVVEEIGRL